MKTAVGGVEVLLLDACDCLCFAVGIVASTVVVARVNVGRLVVKFVLHCFRRDL